MTRYILLKNKQQRLQPMGLERLSLPDMVGPASPGSSFTSGVALPEPEILVEDLDANDRREAERDPSIIDMAMRMPTRLIEPRDSEADIAGGGSTWGVSAVGADGGGFDGAGVKVAVLDTGIDAGHPAFTGVTLEQKDFSGDGNGDVQGHGTHCAGTVFGRDVDGTRIGVAPGVTHALIGKVLGDDGSGGSEMLFDGMQWASGESAQVISMSLGFDFPGLVEDIAGQGVPIKLATSIALEGYRSNLRMFDSLMAMIKARADFNGGTVVVAASGNESERQIDPNFEVSASLPAAARGIVSVGALGETDAGLTVADFSNTNPVVSAPGVNVLSANVGGGLRALNGTSMACPHVAGIAALWWQRNAGAGIPLGADAVVARMRASCVTDVFAAGVDVLDRGDGLVQAPVTLTS